MVRNACQNAYYVLHIAPIGAPGNVLRVDDVTGVRTLFATYTAASPPSNTSLLIRTLVILPPGPGNPGSGGG